MTDVSSRLLERAASPDAFTPPRAPEARAGKIASGGAVTLDWPRADRPGLRLAFLAAGGLARERVVEQPGRGARAAALSGGDLARVARGRHPDARPQLAAGLLILGLAVILRCVSGLAAELFTMRASMLLALVGLTVAHGGFRQVWHWWLPFVVAGLSIPCRRSSRARSRCRSSSRHPELGASLLRLRNVPVVLDGNVIRLPGHQLFVAEACSGLRSLTALLALGVLLGGLMLRSPISRLVLLALAIPVAIAINGVRVFLFGFLVLFVDPKLAEGFTHITERLAALPRVAVGARWARVALSARRAPGSPLARCGGRMIGIRALPAAVLAVGCLLVGNVRPQERMALSAPLGTLIPREVAGMNVMDQKISDEERRVAGQSDYVMRLYGRDSLWTYSASSAITTRRRKAGPCIRRVTACPAPDGRSCSLAARPSRRRRLHGEPPTSSRTDTRTRSCSTGTRAAGVWRQTSTW